jgi:xylulose-5-phosphate/fructose-6-phosphate phosphoketolase
MNPDRILALDAYIRAANYISAAQIYLRDNVALESPLLPEHIKPRLLGHWGTCPGINFTYAHLNEFIRTHDTDMLFVLGPGHGFAALQANLFMEGTLARYYPEASQNESGLAYIVKNFSWPFGFPSHSSPSTPGVILEGGELGYALATAYGAALDNPDLTVVCMVGDGEAETGPTATAWHLNKFISPVEHGHVIPILHLNGYKISGPTIFGRMKNSELAALFKGYGYDPIIVEGAHLHEKMASALEKAHAYAKEARAKGHGKDEQDGILRPPMIILKTPKGWTGIATLHGEKIEGNALSHQVVAPHAKEDQGERRALEKWMTSYQFSELFGDRGFSEVVQSVLPKPERRMGNNRQCFGGKSVCTDLAVPDVAPFLNNKVMRGVSRASNMEAIGEYLRDVFRLNDISKNFRLFSPDETYSNKLAAVFEATSRAFVREIKPWDKDMSPSGRVIEILSEHTLQGLIQGYILTGRHGVFASYEAFLQVVASMADQYTKFIRVAREISWRGAVSSLNYILTSPGWRQEHNGFSHQNPGFIDTMLQKHGCFVHVYFPADRNTALLVMEHCLRSHNEVNLIVTGKSMEPEWLTPKEARDSLERGLLIWKFASDENPDIVLSAAGDYLVLETLAAIQMVREAAPEIKMRFVNILELSALGVGNEECRAPMDDFDDYFTDDKPVIFNFHGYPETLKQALFDRVDGKRPFSVHGYIEVGSTTTPLDMHVRNKTSRFQIAHEIYGLMSMRGVIDAARAKDLRHEMEEALEKHRVFIKEHGVDMDKVTLWQWNKQS